MEPRFRRLRLIQLAGKLAGLLDQRFDYCVSAFVVYLSQHNISSLPFNQGGYVALDTH